MIEKMKPTVKYLPKLEAISQRLFLKGEFLNFRRDGGGDVSN
jgi:hypothetical protein